MTRLNKLLKSLPRKSQQRLIANAVDKAIRQTFPDKYMALCHMYAIVGSNILTIASKETYIPVGGIALIDAGRGVLLEMLDNDAFNRERGGPFHCWIESVNCSEIELVDLSFRHNPAYAQAHGIEWKRKRKSYLWGVKKDINLDISYERLPKKFPKDKVWFHQTSEGTKFITHHVETHMKVYTELTTLALRYLMTAAEQKCELLSVLNNSGRAI